MEKPERPEILMYLCRSRDTDSFCGEVILEEQEVCDLLDYISKLEG